MYVDSGAQRVDGMECIFPEVYWQCLIKVLSNLFLFSTLIFYRRAS